MPLNTFSSNKRWKNCEQSRWPSQSALVWPLAVSSLDALISLTPKHKLIVSSTLLASATHIQTDRDTTIHNYAQTTDINYELFK